MEYITVIGSRDITPEEDVTLMFFNRAFQELGFCLRSGAADGADKTVTYFHNVEIYIPWNGFAKLYHDGQRVFSLDKLPDTIKAKQKMKKIHPAPDKLTQGAEKLHTRNIYQVIGKDGANGQKSCLVLYCANEDIVKNEPIGGTRTAVMFARELDIPTFNIRNAKDLSFENILNKIELQAK